MAVLNVRNSSNTAWYSFWSIDVTTLGALADVTTGSPTVGDTIQWNGSEWTSGSISGVSGPDLNAIHDNEANEISALSEKVTPTADDIFLIEDSDSSYAKKKVKLSSIATSTSGSDASNISYTPLVLADWDSDADPGNVDDALDQLAQRVDDLELTSASLTVREVDTSPSVSATTIEFPNGTLSDQGGGTVRYTPSASSGGTSILEVQIFS